MKKDSFAAGKGAVAAEPMKKMDSEDEDAEDLGAPVVKGDEKKADAAKKVKQDASIKSSQKGDQKADSVKEGYTDDEIRAYVTQKTMTVQQSWNIQFGDWVNRLKNHTQFQTITVM